MEHTGGGHLTHFFLEILNEVSDYVLVAKNDMPLLIDTAIP